MKKKNRQEKERKKTEAHTRKKIKKDKNGPRK